MPERPRVAIAHDYLTQRGGAERVVLAMSRAFPDAPIYTTLFEAAETFREFEKLDVRTSWINRFGFFRRHHRRSLPILPFAAASLRVDADVVLASSSGWAHGFPAEGRKLVYCYTPARWLYQPQRYLGDHPDLVSSLALRVLRPLLTWWDRRAARTADEYVTISSISQDRILTAYGRSSTVLPGPWPNTVAHPPAAIPEVENWLGDDSFELCVSRLLPYKNVRAVVEAYLAEPRRKLVIVGQGPEKEHLTRIAGPNVFFVQNISDEQLAWLYRRTNALVAVSYEDYGLTPLEAASFGKPSIVLRWGGFVDTMIENVTAVFVDSPTPDNIRHALAVVDERTWESDRIVEHADRFSEDVFVEAIRALVKEHLAAYDAR